jgi:hypothetical protein
MNTPVVTQLTVERLSLSSNKPFESVLAAIRGGIGHPDMNKLWEEMERRLLSKSRIDRQTCARPYRPNAIRRIR